MEYYFENCTRGRSWVSWKSMHARGESFQLQMGFSFPFLLANDLRSSLLNIRARSF